MTTSRTRRRSITCDARLVETAARVTLGTAPPPNAPWRPPATDDTLDVIARHRIAGAFLHAISLGWVVAPDELVERLVERHVTEMQRSLMVDALLDEVSERLATEGLRAVVVKGAATAHLDLADPAWRAYNDLDLLVPASSIDRVVETLEVAGFARDLPERRPGWDHRLAKDITLVSPQGIECDLHRTLVPGAFGFWLDLERLTAQTTEFEVAGRSHLALDPAGRVLHAALALTVGEPRPRVAHALDLAIALGKVDDVAQIAELAASSRGVAPLHDAVALVAAVLADTLAELPDLRARLDHLERLARLARSTRLERAACRTYRRYGGTNTTTLLGGLLAIDGLASRVAYLRGLVRPDRRYRHARRATARPPEWRTGAGELAATLRP